MKTIKTEAFDLALKFITETNVNIFLTGKAGTGKTTFLKYLRENSTKNMAVAAPTGVAAINAGGVTLHSMFQLPFGPFIPTNKVIPGSYDRKTLLSRLRFNSEKINFFNALELLVIDEASMVAAYAVDAIDTILRAVRHKQAPFGGVQVLFIGDLYQLQPVVKDEEWQILKDYYSSSFFFDSHVLRDNIPVMVELKTIFRQKDEHFIDILNGLRENTLTKEHLEILNNRMNPDFVSKEGDGYITLTTHNNNANRINEVKLNKLRSRPFKFTATIEGEFPENINPAERELYLKKDAQVMFIKNDLEEKRYYNGKIGIICEISDDEIVVQCDDDKISVKKHIWENLNYSVNPATKEIKETLLGTFKQYPLRLAWAITIHKSQGLTFDKVVIDTENAFANGQVYVALSRATSLEGLILTSKLNDRFLGPHADLKNWQENKHDENSLPSLFENARQDYMKQLLFNSFSFEQFIYPFQKLRNELEEFKNESETIGWINQIFNKHETLNATAVRFKQQLHSLWNENSDPKTNEKLNIRVREAAAYFSEQVLEWKKSISDHPLKISNRKTSRPVDNLLEEINDQIIYCITKIELCRKGFRFNEMAAWKKSLPKNAEQIKSSYMPSHKAEKSEGQSGLYEILSSYRKSVAEENDSAAYLVFSNQSIKNLCDQLPGDELSLLSVSGFGKKKVKDYGADILRIIREYCEDNNIPMNFIAAKTEKGAVVKKSSALSPSIKETIELFKSGKSLSEICSTRNLAQSTIEGHLTIAIKNKLIDIEKILAKDEIKSIAALFSGSKMELKNAFEKSRNEVPYGKLKMVQAWLLAQREL